MWRPLRSMSTVPDGLVGWAKRSVPTICNMRLEVVGTALCAFAHPTKTFCVATTHAAFACTSSQNSASRSASRSVAELAFGAAISATSVLLIGAKPSFAVSTR